MKMLVIGFILATLVAAGTFPAVKAFAKPAEAQVPQVVAFIGAPFDGTGLGNGDVEMVWKVLFFGDGVANGGLDFDEIAVMKEDAQGLGSYITEVEGAVKARALAIGYELTRGVRIDFTTFSVP